MQLEHVVGVATRAHGLASLVADTAVVTMGAGTLTLYFFNWLDLGMKLTIGALTIVLLILRIRAHLANPKQTNP